jgi:hypothetical protein
MEQLISPGIDWQDANEEYGSVRRLELNFS